MLDLPDSRKDERDDGRRGVVGREFGRRFLEPERFVLLSRGVVEEDIVVETIVTGFVFGGCYLYVFSLWHKHLSCGRRDRTHFARVIPPLPKMGTGEPDCGAENLTAQKTAFKVIALIQLESCHYQLFRDCLDFLGQLEHSCT